MLRPSSARITLAREAMATAFSIAACHDDAPYARQAAAAALAELERLEGHLSRFVEGSDVWRINRLARGQAATVSLDTFRCLSVALEMQALTAGAFDVTYTSTCNAPPEERLELTSAGCRVRALADGVRIDLSGIGKGYALDAMAETLREWDVTRALLAASASTLLALDPPADEPGWNVAFGPDHDLRRMALSHAALSGSGVDVQGCHIVDPRTRRPVDDRVQAWSQAATGAQADALSTALMVLSATEIRDCLAGRALHAYWLDARHGSLGTFPDTHRLQSDKELRHATP